MSSAKTVVLTPPKQANVPAAELLAALRSEADFRREHTIEALSVATHSEQLKKELQRKMRALCRPKGYEAWRMFVAERRTKLRKEIESRPGAQEEKVRQIIEKNKRVTLSFLRNHSLDPSALRKLNHGALEKYLAIVRHPETTRNAEVTRMAPAVPRSLSAWTTFRPPYQAAYAWVSDEWLRGFWKASSVPDHWYDRFSGLVGNINFIIDMDADDYDIGIYDYDTYVTLWYKMPSAGLLEMYIEGQVGSCNHFISLEDEFGVSNAIARQSCYFFMQATGSQRSKVIRATASTLTKSGTDVKASISLTPGSIIWGHLYSDVPFRKDEWVYIRAGIQTHNDCFANDVEVQSMISCKWCLKSIWTRST